MCGLLGHGDAFVLRDPNGIRPAYWYEDDEVVVAASERRLFKLHSTLKQTTLLRLNQVTMIIRREELLL